MSKTKAQSSKKGKSSKSGKSSKKDGPTIEETYTMKELHEHILDIPDTYIGSVKEDSNKMWVYDKELIKMVLKNITYVPGLYKIFDEIIVNARDHSVRDKTCTLIKIWINKETGEISCYNNGKEGIPIAIHKKHKIYVPEMLFGNLLTSGNYDQVGKIVGGKNGSSYGPSSI